MLGPIHLTRVAAVGYRAVVKDLLGGEPPPWEADPGDPLDVGNPLLPAELEARSAAAFGLPSPRRRG